MPPTPIKMLSFAACLLAMLAASGNSPAQDEAVLEPLPAETPRILGTVADGTPPPPAPVPVMPDYRVLDTVVSEQGGRTVTVHRVEPPDLPERLASTPAPEIDLDDPEVQTWLEQQRQEAKKLRLTIISATVIDHEVTLLRWWVFGDGDGKPPEAFSAYSNVDFNHLAGFGSYEVGDVQFGLLMGLGNTDTEARRKLFEEHGVEYKELEIPELPAGEPAYVITGGDTTNEEGVALIDGLHKLYKNEKDRLIAAYEGREAARIEREAFLKAHPPKPKDITIHFWRTKREEAPASDQNGGDQ